MHREAGTLKKSQILPVFALAASLANGFGCAARSPAMHAVAIRNFTYVAPTITAQAGDTIAWVNEDAVPHTATTVGVFDSGGIESGNRWQYVTREKGRFSYTCAFHPTMQGTIVVE